MRSSAFDDKNYLYNDHKNYENFQYKKASIGKSTQKKNQSANIMLQLTAYQMKRLKSPQIQNI